MWRLLVVVALVGCGDDTQPFAPDAAIDSPIHADGDEVCPSQVPDDPLLAMRQGCMFAAGATASQTLGLSDADRMRIPIRHIVVIMKENHAFDQYFSQLKATQPEIEAFPAGFTNRDLNGTPVAPFHSDTTCIHIDPDHQWTAMHNQVNGGRMDGFVTSAATSTNSDGHYAMAYFDATDLPFYYFLANTYAITDHHFPSVRSGTFPNRDYMLMGTSDDVHATNSTVWPDPNQPTIFDFLDRARVTWGVYSDDVNPLEGTFADPNNDWGQSHPWHPVHDLIAAFAASDVPSVVFVDGREYVEDEHPTANVQVGEAWTKAIYDAAITSPVWPTTAILLAYDEGGGFFDHMPPPNACLARPQDTDFFELGVRVPLIAISPWARRHYVSHAISDHTSISRFIEAVYGLPAMTARDANADALLDLFDFHCPPADPPRAPAASTGGCH